MPTLPRTVPHSQAPYSASLRAWKFPGSFRIAGKARPKAAMPSCASRSMTGLPSAAYSPSAACAMALMPLVTLIATGRRSVSSGS